MDNVSPTKLLAQAEDDAEEDFESFMRIAARTAFMNVMLEEVAQLCGPA